MYSFSFFLSSNEETHGIEFVWFDFHAECKNNHFENVNKLIDQTRASVEQGGYFQFDKNKKKIVQLQASIIRTNCVDCLDRIF